MGLTRFKLAIIYIGLFLSSFVAIGTSVYLLTLHSLEQQLKVGIGVEAQRLLEEYEDDGLDGLADEIREDENVAHLYGLQGAQGQWLAGRLRHFAPEAGWQMLSDADTPLIYAQVIALPQGGWLVVGQDGAAIQATGRAIIQAFLSGMVLVLVLGVGGGVYLSRTFLQKIAAITLATEAIIAGDLKRRLPVARHHDELDKLALLLNLMLDKIGLLLDNVQQVSNDIAHDLRTPISRLQFGLADALAKPQTVSAYQDCIGRALEEVEQVLATFSALLRIAQIESGSRRSGFKPVNLSAVLKSVAEALEPVAEEQGKCLVADVASDLMVIGDQELLTQLAFNLVENALLHTPAQTRISLSLQAQGSHLEWVVADNGPGIPQAYRAKVMQRFYRLEQSRTTPGNGLGLSIAAAVVELHEGRLQLLDNQPGLRVVVSGLQVLPTLVS
ncbi:HAMP domain-containing histidine kinase [Methylovulum psychrotolerans]|jgi:signal transduction histidine kinase|uniref:sensor histidine kinase n=1 Tax=Methylovulum psychrotolerans TaxID=1704499 RepID=UPI001BFFAE84|nr:HAMP domain-containing sensor histidine kinase [Methylovulum psychrotolerans]MBT9099924.1 HAMP domain-containing histidine kinase [Methylovulum psychrotolerans]